MPPSSAGIPGCGAFEAYSRNSARGGHKQPHWPPGASDHQCLVRQIHREADSATLCSFLTTLLVSRPYNYTPSPRRKRMVDPAMVPLHPTSIGNVLYPHRNATQPGAPDLCGSVSFVSPFVICVWESKLIGVSFTP